MFPTKFGAAPSSSVRPVADPAGSPRRALTTTFATVLLLLLTACSSGTADSAPPAGPSAADLGAAQHLLADSFASNGKRGFFVEGDGVSDTISLYDTRWWSEAFNRDHRLAVVHLQAGSVRSWAVNVAEGNASSVDSQTMPTLERVDDATALATDLGGTVGGGAIVREISALRKGSEFAASANGTPDLGDTALALTVYRRIGVKPPTQVVSGEHRRLLAVLGDRRRRDIPKRIVPVLSAAGNSDIAARRSAAGSELRWLGRQIAGLAAPARLSMYSSLAKAYDDAGLRSWMSRRACRGISPASKLTVPGSTEADPQLRAEAVGIGCVKTVDAPPWTASGWPGQQAIAESLPASVDGMRLARASGVGQKYVNLVRRQLSTTWAPQIRRSPGTTIAVAGDLLCRELFVPLLSPVTRAMAEHALAQAPSGAGIVPLLLGLIAYPRGLSDSAPPNTRTETGDGSDQFQAAQFYELQSRLSNNADEHATALHIVQRFEVKGEAGVYALSKGGAASLVATIFGNWIARKPLQSAGLSRVGLCTGYWRCKGDGNAGILPPLMIAAAAAVLAQQSNGSYPFAY
jgi:hypothetical protein